VGVQFPIPTVWEYDEHGEELYGILRNNIYGSPLASRNWSIDTGHKGLMPGVTMQNTLKLQVKVGLNQHYILQMPWGRH
jgi:hypothetical protein